MSSLQRYDPLDITKYFLGRAFDVGDLLTPLKMQKLLYYAYCWSLVKTNHKLFTEDIEAWVNGPVVRSVYNALKEYGAKPIDERFIGEEPFVEYERIIDRFAIEDLNVLDKVFEYYNTFSALELSVLTHSERPWIEARRGLSPRDNNTRPIKDVDIRIEFGDKDIDKFFKDGEA